VPAIRGGRKDKRKMKNNNIVLTEIGFVIKDPYDQKDYREPNQEEISICEKWINKYCKIIKRTNSDAFSYSLKHKVEEWSKQYISNGAFISAAIKLGYEYIVCGNKGPNAIFNMSLYLPENSWSLVRPTNFTRWLFRQKKEKGIIGDLSRVAIIDSSWPRKAKMFIEFRFYLERTGACEGCLKALSEAWLKCYNSPPPFPNSEVEANCDKLYDGQGKILNYGELYPKAPKEKTYIYVLFEPETDLKSLQVRYVGQTKNPSIRLKQHIVSPGSIKKVIWVGDLINKGIYPLMGIIDLVDDENVSFMEDIYLLAFYERERKFDQSNDDNLLNTLLIEKYLPIYKHGI
jgi:hypothetical protein